MKTILQKTSNQIFLAFLILVSFTNVNAQVVSYSAMNTITCPNTPVATIAPSVTGLTFSQISRGAGVTCSAANGSISGSGYNGNLATNITASKWYNFTITSDAATSFNLNSLSIVSRASNATGANVSVQYSIGTGAKTVIGSYTPTSNSATYLVTPVSPILVAANQVITIFIIPNGLTASTTTCRVENNTSVNVTTTSVSASPTITTSPATSITTTSATLSGNVTNIGGSAVSASGIVYAETSLVPTPTIGALSVTNLSTATPNAAAGTFSGATSVLSPNTQYSFRGYATNTQGTSYGSAITFYTLANVPTNPIVDGPTQSTLNVTIGANDGNPFGSNTQYAIQVNGDLFVQANGALGATPVWQTAPTWATKTVTGLTSNSLYFFAVKARNGANIETITSENVSGATLANTSATLTQVGTLTNFGTVCLNLSAPTQSFSFDGTNLNSTDFSIAALSGFTFSSTETGTYTPTLTILNTSTSVSGQVVWVKFSPTQVQSYSGSISISGGGLVTPFLVSALGQGVNSPASLVTTAATTITATTSQINGTYTQECSAVSAYGFEISATSGFANGTGTAVASTNAVSGVYSAVVSGLNPNTTYFFKSVATDATGTVYGTQSSFTTSNLSAPVATTASAVTLTEFAANWNPVVGATSYNIDVSTSPTFGTVANATDLIISEYVEGSSNNKVLELYNGTGTSINLADYSIKKQSNGAGAFGSNLALTGTLANGATYVIANSSSSAAIQALANLTTNSVAINFNGNDAVGLYKLGAQIDVVGILNQETPNWGDNRTLVRKSTVLSPTTAYSASDWNLLAIDVISNLGAHTINGTVGSFLPGYENLSVASISQIVTGLSANTPYYYRVRATNATTTSTNSNVIEVSTINVANLTSLVASSCNVTLPVISATIYATPKSGVSGYRFEVTNLSTNAVQIKDKPLQFFRLTELANYDYATTYSVRVMLKVGTTWLGYYGDACLVSTQGLGSPTQSSLGVISPICGSVIPTNTTIYTTPLSGATGYRFRVRTAGQPEYILDKTLQFFAFNSLLTYVNGAAYTVEVAVKTTGDYTPYGPVCNFTTVVPSIAATTCNSTIAATGVVYAMPLPNVSSYIFTVTNTTTNVTYPDIVRPLQFFLVSLIPGYSVSNQYDIKVAVVTKGQTSAAGLACSINPISGVIQTSTTSNSDFKAVGSPNPFETSFVLDLSTIATDAMTIQVYDMIGKQLEYKLVQVSDQKTIEFGSNYPAGVYNIVVTQGETTKSFRIIKR